MSDELAVEVEIVVAERQSQAGDIDRDVDEAEADEGELGRDRLREDLPVDLAKLVQVVELPGAGVDSFDFEDPAGAAQIVERGWDGEKDEVEDDRDGEEIRGDDEWVGEAGGDDTEDDGERERHDLRQVSLPRLATGAGHTQRPMIGAVKKN